MGNSFTKEEYKLLKKYLEDSLGTNERYSDDSLYTIIKYSEYNQHIIKENIQLYLKKKPEKGCVKYPYHKDIYEFLYKVPYTEIPLYINDETVGVLAQWRLEIGK